MNEIHNKFYSRYLTDLEIDPCRSNPCSNQATCITL
ncbi:hypothetical protein T09_3067, partial [Trichinella sp. T9]